LKIHGAAGALKKNMQNNDVKKVVKPKAVKKAAK